MQFIKHSLEIAFIVLLIGFILYVVFRPMVKRDNFNARQWLHNNTFFLCAAWIVVCLWHELCNFTVIAYQTEILQFVLFALSLLHLALTGYLYGRDKINTGNIEVRAEAMTRKLLLFTLCFLPTALLITFSIMPIAKNERAIVYRFGTYQSVLGPGVHFRIPLITDPVLIDITQRDISVGSADIANKTYTADGRSVIFILTVNCQLDPQKYRYIYDNNLLWNDYGPVTDYTLSIKSFAYTGLASAINSFTARDLIEQREIVLKAIKQSVRDELRRYPITVHSIIMQGPFLHPFNAEY